MLLSLPLNVVRDTISGMDSQVVIKKVYDGLSSGDSLLERARFLLPPAAMKSLGYVFIVMVLLFSVYHCVNHLSQSLHTRYDVYRAVKMKSYDELVYLASQAGPGKVRDESMHFLASMATDSVQTHKIVRAGGVPHIVRNAMEKADEATRLLSAVALLNICCDDEGQLEVCRCGGLALLKEYISCDDSHVRNAATDAVWILSANVDLRQTIVRAGVLGGVLGVLQYGNDSVGRQKAAGALQNILADPRTHEEALSLGSFDVILDTIAGAHAGRGGDVDDLVAKSVGALANLAMEDMHVDSLLRSGAIQVLMRAANESVNEAVSSQIVGALYNLTSSPSKNAEVIHESRGAIVAFLERVENMSDSTALELAKEIRWNVTRGLDRLG